MATGTSKPLKQLKLKCFLKQGVKADSEISSRPPIVITIEAKEKRPVGRPRKLNPANQPTTKLVDYSSSDSEDDKVEEPKVKKLRKMYSAGQKKKVADYSRHHGVRKAAREFKVSHSNVIRWQRERVDKLKNPNKRQYKRGQGRRLSYPPEIEHKLVAWILERREAECAPISTQIIRCKASTLICPINSSFKASDGWVRKFMRRNNLVLRCRTHISQSLPKDLEENIQGFHVEVASIFESSDFPLDYVCNMDETPVYLDLLPGKVVDKKGRKSIKVRTTASEKNRVTATLCCTASGKMLPPFVVFKGKTRRGLTKVLVPKGVVCTVQAKAWMDEERMMEWIDKVWLPYVGKNRALLCLDTFSAHLTESVRKKFTDIGTKLLVIPGGCTSVLQPLDVSLNKPFKSYIRQQWSQRMISEAEAGAAKIKPASKAVLMQWIKTAADTVEQKSQGIIKSFQVTGIVKRPDSTRSDVLQEEIQHLMEDVFGKDHMGYVEPTEDPFADCDGSSDEDPFTDSESGSQDDPAANDQSDTDYSDLLYSEISGIDSGDEIV